MSTTRSLVASIVLPVTAILALGAAPAHAAASKSTQLVNAGSRPTAPQDVVDVVTRINKTGQPPSPQDRATILRHPEMARTLVDPYQHKPTQHVSTKVTSGAGAAAAYCVYQDRYINYYSYTGSKTVEWHHKLSYCIDATTDNVKRVERSTYLANQVGNWERSGYSLNSEVGNNTPYYSSAFEEKIRQCPQFTPCTDWAYPYSKFVVNGHTHHVDYYWRRG